MWSKEVRERTHKNFGGSRTGSRVQIYVPTHKVVWYTGEVKKETPMRETSIYVKGEDEKLKFTKTISHEEAVNLGQDAGKCKGFLKNGKPCQCKSTMGKFCKRHFKN